MWGDWKLRYKKAYEPRQLAHQAYDGLSQSRNAKVAMGTRPSAPRHSGVRFVNQPAGEPIEYEKLEGYLDNLYHAATNKKAVLQQLTAAVALLTATNTIIMAKNKALTANNKYLVSMACAATTAQPGKGKVRWKRRILVASLLKGNTTRTAFALERTKIAVRASHRYCNTNRRIPAPKKWEGARIFLAGTIYSVGLLT